jgi:hypothetical protein
MKTKFAKLSLIIPMAACLVASARADINFNFDSTYQDYPTYSSTANNVSNVTVQSTDVVGAPGYAEAGWENSPNLGQYGFYLTNVPTMALSDSTGAATGATLTLGPSNANALDGTENLAESQTWDISSSPDSALSVSDRMFNSTITAGGGRAAEFALQDIPYSQYTLVVYLTLSQYQSGSLQLFEGGVVGGAQSPLYFNNGLGWVPLNQYGGYPDSGYTQITSTDINNPTATGSDMAAYALFTGLTGADQTFDLIGNPGVAGFQIIDTAATVPEPSTWALFAMGSLGLVAWRRARAAKLS